MKRIKIPARSAVAVEVTIGQIFRVVNSEGGQVVDLWAFNLQDVNEFLSMSHSRTATYRLMFRSGDTLVSNYFNPIIGFLEDRSPGKHDTLHAACSTGSFKYFGEDAGHPNCQSNLLRCLQDRGFDLKTIPDPWNLFEHTTLGEDLTLRDESASAKPGDYVELRAEQQLLVVCSACPSTIGTISGDVPVGAAVEFPDEI